MAMARTPRMQPAPPVRIGPYAVDPASRRVEGPRGSVRLTRREFALFRHLVAHPGQAFTREQLMTLVWRYLYPGDTSTVTVHMRRLRAKVELDPAHPRHLVTVWGAGYRFEP